MAYFPRTTVKNTGGRLGWYIFNEQGNVEYALGLASATEALTLLLTARPDMKSVDVLDFHPKGHLDAPRTFVRASHGECWFDAVAAW